jgi:cold shock CspA family protein
MNAEAAPFVPKDPEVEPAAKSKPQQGPTDSAGVEVETGGMSGVSLWRPQYRGRVRSYSEQKGFGFISCDETMRQFGRDVFIHRYQMAEHDLKVQQEVLFEVELNKMGHPQARRVRVNEEASWDMQMGYDGYGNGSYYGGGGDMYGSMGGMSHYNYHQDSLHQENMKLKQMLRDAEQGRTASSMSGGLQMPTTVKGHRRRLKKCFANALEAQTCGKSSSNGATNLAKCMSSLRCISLACAANMKSVPPRLL